MPRSAPTAILPKPTPTREQLIDEFGELDRQIREVAPKVARHKALTEQIRSWFTDHPADQPAEADGQLYRIQVKPRSKKRFFNLKAKAAIWKRLGKGALAAFNITQEAVVKAFGEAEKELLLSEELTGTRELIPVLKAPVVGAKAA